MKCIVCETPLTNGVDTFGEVNQEMCWDCWSTLEAMSKSESWYGLAPHRHDLNKTGSYIGSTVYEPLAGEPNANGAYWVESSQLWFTPDEETDGTAGVWSTEEP